MQGLKEWQLEQARIRDEALRNEYLEVLGLDGQIPITVEDISFAERLNKMQLFALAIAASARARNRRAPTPKGDSRE